MILEKRTALKPLIESSGGIHCVGLHSVENGAVQ